MKHQKLYQAQIKLAPAVRKMGQVYLISAIELRAAPA
jgi:hypothetical protein